MQTETEIRSQLEQFEAELASAEAQAKQATRRVNHLRQVVDGLKGLLRAEPEPAFALFQGWRLTTSPFAAAELEAVPLKGRDAVRAVLEETRRAWKIPELAEEIQRRGWMPGVASPRDATAASVQRLVYDGVAERVGHGVYRMRLDKLPPAVEEGGD